MRRVSRPARRNRNELERTGPNSSAHRAQGGCQSGSRTMTRWAQPRNRSRGSGRSHSHRRWCCRACPVAVTHAVPIRPRATSPTGRRGQRCLGGFVARARCDRRPAVVGRPRYVQCESSARCHACCLRCLRPRQEWSPMVGRFSVLRLAPSFVGRIN